MRTRVKLTLNEFESRQMLDAAPVLPPPGGPDAVQTAPPPAVPEPALSQATLDEFNRFADFTADADAVIRSLDADLQASGAFPGMAVTGVGAGLTTDGVGSAAPQAVVMIYIEPRPGEAIGQDPQIMIYRPPSGLDAASTIENYGWRETLDAVGHGFAGAGAGAGAVAGGATGGATGAVVGTFVPVPGVGTLGGLVAGTGGGAIVGGITGFIRGVTADDTRDAAIGGATVGAVAGVPGGGIGAGVRIVVAGGRIVAAEAAAAALVARHNEIRANIENLNRFVLNNAGSGSPIVQEQVRLAREQAASFTRILVGEGGRP